MKCRLAIDWAKSQPLLLTWISATDGCSGSGIPRSSTH